MGDSIGSFGAETDDQEKKEECRILHVSPTGSGEQREPAVLVPRRFVTESGHRIAQGLGIPCNRPSTDSLNRKSVEHVLRYLVDVVSIFLQVLSKRQDAGLYGMSRNRGGLLILGFFLDDDLIRIIVPSAIPIKNGR